MPQRATGFLQLLFGIPILTVNIIVLYVLLKYIARTTKGSCLLINLTLADILVGITIILHSISNLNQGFSEWKDACAFRFSSMVFSSFASLFAVLLTALDRYFCVCHHGNSRIVSTNRTKTVALLFWLYCLVLTMWPIIFNSYQMTSHTGVCLPSKGYLAVIPVQYFLILLGMCILYAKMCHIAKKKKRQIITSQSNLVLNSRLMKFQHELRGAKFMAIILVSFICCWTPFVVCLILLQTRWVSGRVLDAAEISAFLGVLNSLINPLIYPLQNRRFRNATYQLLGRIKKQFRRNRTYSSEI